MKLINASKARFQYFYFYLFIEIEIRCHRIRIFQVINSMLHGRIL